jgi:hypothetical protein
MSFQARALLGLLRILRLPSLAPVAVDAGQEAAFDRAADALLRGETGEIPERRLDFLRWLAENRPVAFHGSPLGDLAELSTERRSTDTTKWGNQQAVYASNDPVWAIYFACLRRDGAWTGTRNGSMGTVGGPLYPRRYFFLHNRGSEAPDRFGPGTLYVLPLDGFVADAPLAGVVDTAHLVSHAPVSPLARIRVTPADFPFADRLAYYRNGESIVTSLVRASFSATRRTRLRA